MSITLAQTLESLKNEITVNENGIGYVSIRGAARLAGISHNALLMALAKQRVSASKLQQSLKNKGLIPQNWGKQGIPINGLVEILHYYGFEAGRYNNSQAKKLWEFYQNHKTFDGFNFESKNKPKIAPEKIIADKLQLRLKGCKPEMEVRTPGGVIDLLTEKQIIEIKVFSGWKSAIGQVLVYGMYYPKHEKRIHLFGKIDPKMLGIIQTHCDALNIVLTLEKSKRLV